jgi:hypothetical protein
MKQMLSIFALALSGVFVASAGAYAAQAHGPVGGYWQTAAVMSPSLGLGSSDNQRDVIEPPSSIDPGMSLDPPQTGAKMPIIRPPGAPAHGLILPR